ncbi:hypothetical protein LshimejAT787_0704550 [Lyophyllum shimeji]|uniref:Uncharacterized protein n=1 Tax=Lyophyllum shimeji TaxID=47721 RepID=A0A9P3PNY8_LYOSH|nr:hypothetical protein LshimejAT787_0704550 [Lyophyllum shimeji]
MSRGELCPAPVQNQSNATALITSLLPGVYFDLGLVLGWLLFLARPPFTDRRHSRVYQVCSKSSIRGRRLSPNLLANLLRKLPITPTHDQIPIPLESKDPMHNEIVPMPGDARSEGWNQKSNDLTPANHFRAHSSSR